MTTPSTLQVAELVSLNSTAGINFVGPYRPTFNGLPLTAGDPGAPGINSATILLFQRTITSTPPAPPVGAVTYTFATGETTGVDNGWTRSLPTTGGTYRWQISATAFSNSATDLILPTEWATPALISTDGNPGNNTATVQIYTRSPSLPSLPSADVTYTFSTASATGLTGGWSTSFPSGTDPVWASAASAVSTSNTDVIHNNEWTSPVILVINGSPGSKGDTGNSGSDGHSTATVYLYQWSPIIPSPPSGSNTYNWTTATSSGSVNGLTGGGVWTPTIPSNPGTPGLQLWVCAKNTSAVVGTVSSTVTWVGNEAVSSLSQNGQGLKTAEVAVYKWSSTIPAGPAGSRTYNWTTKSAGTEPTTPSGWNFVANDAYMIPGYTLWKAYLTVADSSTSNTTSFDWVTAQIIAIGYAGTQGPAGPADVGSQGASARICYAKLAAGSTPSSTPDPFVVVGDVPASPGTWGVATWSTTTPTIGVNEQLYQSNGIYNPATNQTAWGAPFLSSLKVGSLSAISANLGTISSGNITLDPSSFIKSFGATYGGPSGFWMGYSGGTYKVSIGGLTYDGTTLSVPAASITGKLSASQIRTDQLVITDSSGSVAIGPGATLNPANYMAVPLGWLNTQITLGNNGTLLNAGGGQVTAVGINAVHTNLSNAPSSILNNQITITPTGTLENAGGGQVTALPTIDLGYTTSFGSRDRNDHPYEYPVGSMRQFKEAYAIGLPSYFQGFVTLETTKQYSDNTGGGIYQYAYQNNYTWRRYSSTATGSNATWTAWVQDLDRNAYVGDLDATKGAQAGVNLKDSGGSILSDTVIKNTAITVSSGILQGIGTPGIAVDNNLLAVPIADAATKATWTNVTNRPTDLNGLDSTAATKLNGIQSGATVGATWGLNVGNIPASLADGRVATAIDGNGIIVSKIKPGLIASPTTSGLYMGSDYMGFYNSSTGSWATYMANNGDFFLGGTNGALRWSNGQLIINGSGTFTGNLSAASGTLGTVTTGFLSNPSGTSFINLNAVGTQDFISINNGRARITADGDAYFLKTLGSGTVTGLSLTVRTLDTGSWVNVSATYELDTGLNLPYADTFGRNLVARITSITCTPGSSGGNYIYSISANGIPSVVYPVFDSSAPINEATNPYGVGNARVNINFTFKCAGNPGSFTIRVTGFRWELSVAR